MYEHLAKMAERIGWQTHDEAPDPQEDSSDKVGEDIADKIRAQDLKWTTDPPTEPGWYWAKWERGDDMAVVLVTTPTKDENKLVVGVPGFAQPFELHYFHYYLGPIPAPEPPQGVIEMGL